jgi:6-phosphogluconolactonase (cycloisomerase 2 family)
MKFTKIGKALLMGAFSAGVVFSLSACKQDYTVGYLYVTETATSGTSGSGQVTGFTIDHNSGSLHQISGLPVSSGGANPSRAVLMPGGRFLFVLNRGSNSSAPSGEECTTTYPCSNGGVTVFSVGGNGSLTQQGSIYTTKGLNPFRMVIDSTGSYLYVLGHDAYADDGSHAASSTYPNALCYSMFSTYEGCGVITAYSIDSSTGYLNPVSNKQASSSSTVMYFPVPANPVDFSITSSYLITLTGSTTDDYSPYSYTTAGAGATSYYPYGISSSSSATNGLLYLLSSSSETSLGISGGTSITYANGYVYVLDNESSSDKILAFTVSSGALSTQTGSPFTEDSTVSKPVALLVESGAKWAYIANYGNGTDENNALSKIQGFTIDSTYKTLTTLSGSPWGTGSGPTCLVEDPSNQFLYSANYVSKNITGRVINQITGGLDSATGSATLDGPATWCLVDGRTN